MTQVHGVPRSATSEAGIIRQDGARVIQQVARMQSGECGENALECLIAAMTDVNGTKMVVVGPMISIIGAGMESAAPAMLPFQRRYRSSPQ
jgi:CII-binding regulator of phage lambda lysogenization HflD